MGKKENSRVSAKKQETKTTGQVHALFTQLKKAHSYKLLQPPPNKLRMITSEIKVLETFLLLLQIFDIRVDLFLEVKVLMI